MSSLTELLDGPELTIRIGDREYSFSELPVASLGVLQAWVNQNTPHPLDSLKGHMNGLPDAVQFKLAEAARQDAKSWPPQIGTGAGVMALLGSPAGQREAFFLGLQKHHGLTREASDRLYRQLDRDHVNGERLGSRIFKVLFGQGDPDRETPDENSKSVNGFNPAALAGRSTGD